MAGGDSDLTEAFLAKFHSALTGGGGAGSTSFLSYIDGGIAFSDAALAFLGEGGVPQNLEAAYNFAKLADTVPPVAGAWQSGGPSMSDLYRNYFLRNAVTPPATLSGQQQQALRAATETSAELYPTYCKYRNAWQNANADYQGLLLASDKSGDHAAQLARKRADADEALRLWEGVGRKVDYEAAIGTVNRLESLGYARIVEDLKERFDDYVAGFTYDGKTFAPVLCIPPDFNAPGAVWNEFTFDAQGVAAEAGSPLGSGFWGGGFGNGRSLFWTAEEADAVRAVPRPVSAENLHVSFEYVRVTLDRSAWFSPAFLRSDAWWFQGAWKGNPTYGLTLSDGAPPPATRGLWPMIPEDVVFTRNLRVSFDNAAAANRAAVEKLASSPRAGFMSFGLFATDAATGGGVPAVQVTDSGIFAPQMQMFCFLCSLMPKEPNPDVSFLPDKQPGT